MRELTVSDIQISNSLEITPAQIRECAWTGVWAPPTGWRDQRTCIVMASIFESEGHPGYFHCRVVGSDMSETRKPVLPEGVCVMMEGLLANYGRTCSDLRWSRANTEPADTGHAWTAEKKRVGEIVYFLRAGDFVKIGKATGSPDDRVAQLKTGCPFPIEVIATIPGGYEKERELHNRFADVRAHGEWFHATPRLMSFIASVGVAA